MPFYDKERYGHRFLHCGSINFGTIDKFYISEIIIPFIKILTGKIISLEVRDSIDGYPEYKQLKGIKEEFSNKELLLLLEKSLLDRHIFLELCGETIFFAAVLFTRIEVTEYFLDNINYDNS